MARQQESWLRRNRQYVIIGCAAAAGTVAAYKVYRSERVKATQKALQSLQDTLAKYSDAATSAGDVLAVVSKDLQEFLASDTDEVPRSLKQLGKLARSPEVQDTLAACVSSAVKGMMATTPAADGLPAEPSVVDRVIEAVLSERGHSLVGLAVRTAAQTSSDAFCSALVQGIQVAVGCGQIQQQQDWGQQRQHAQQPLGAVSSSPLASPARPQHLHGGLHPAVATLVTVLGNPHVLNVLDNLVSTTVGSAVGAYIQKAGQESMMASMMDCLAQPGNKDIVIDVMSSVSAAFCREMAAACVAPAATVASRPPSRLDSVEQHTTRALHAASSAGSPFKALHHSYSIASVGAEGSEPSTPQSGPSTPEPSVAAEPAASGVAGLGCNSFAGSAVAGLIMRRNSFPGAGWGGGAMNNLTVDPAALGPMSTLVSLFVQAARFQEFRSLMVDVSRSSTREFVLSLLPSSWSLTGRGTRGSSLASATLAACLYRVYTTMCVLLLLVLYAVGPKTVLEGGRV